MMRDNKVLESIFDPAFALKKNDKLIVLSEKEKLQEIEGGTEAL